MKRKMQQNNKPFSQNTNDHQLNFNTPNKNEKKRFGKVGFQMG